MFVHKIIVLLSFLLIASKGQRASASHDDTSSCQVHRAQSHPAAGEQQPCHISSSHSPFLLFVLIGTHVFINPFLHLLISLLNKNSCLLMEAVNVVWSTSADIWDLIWCLCAELDVQYNTPKPHPHLNTHPQRIQGKKTEKWEQKK